MVTQGNPLRPNLGHVEIEFYGSQPCLRGGANTEVSTKLTLVRRPGSVPYNSATFPAINRFYENRTATFNAAQTSTSESIQVIADTASVVYDATGPSTKTALFTKSSGAGSTYFQSVGNVLYFSNGLDNEKYVTPEYKWFANTTYQAGQYIKDPNGNIQQAIGSQSGTIEAIQVVDIGGGGSLVTVFLSPSTPVDYSGTFGGYLGPVSARMTLSGLTNNPSLNGLFYVVQASANSTQFTLSTNSTLTPVSYSAETGTMSTGNGITGATPPTWQTSQGFVTPEFPSSVLGAQWVNRGSAVRPWAYAAPTISPTVSQVQAPSLYASWAASTWYASLAFIIEDTNGNLQKLTTSGTTGTSQPTWNMTTGGTTLESVHGGTAVWTNLGPSAWAATTAYLVGAAVQAQYSYWITVPTVIDIPYGGYTAPTITYVQQQVTTTSIFVCTTAGTSGSSTPNPWSNGVGNQTQDNTVVWQCVGTWQNSGQAQVWGLFGASQTLSNAPQITGGGNIQNPNVMGESGSMAPNPWSTQAVGGQTTDNTETWTSAGEYASANTGPWIYAYSGLDSVTQSVTTASPLSLAITQGQGNQVVIQGQGMTANLDTIILWRTVQGGSTLFYLDEFPNPGLGQVWTYTDTTPDTGLNELIEAPVDDSNNPPPVGMTALAYHLGRIWGAFGNIVQYSDGPDVTFGNGNEAWNPLNFFEFPSTVTRLWPTSNGLIVFTVSGFYVIQGLGTSTSSFFSTPFLENVGLSSYDAFCVNGTIPYLYTSDNQVMTIDASSGFSEVGFNIGDQFGPNNGTGTFNPTSAHLTYNFSGSQEKALYVSDFSGNWWRMLPTPSPESGTTWCPLATIANGFSAVQSVETTPGTHNLLIGPASSGPILMRSQNTFTDNNVAYNAYGIIGSLVVAQPGQIAMVECITTDSVAIGDPISLAIQLDEIAPLSSGFFEPLLDFSQDPTELAPSISTYAQRFYLSQTQRPAECRHFQLQINFGANLVKNELLSLSVFGGFEQSK